MANRVNFNPRSWVGINQGWVSRNIDGPVNRWFNNFAARADQTIDDNINGSFDGFFGNSKKRSSIGESQVNLTTETYHNEAPESDNAGSGIGGFFANRWETHKSRFNAAVEGFRGNEVADDATFFQKAANKTGLVLGAPFRAVGNLFKPREYSFGADARAERAEMKRQDPGIEEGYGDAYARENGRSFQPIKAIKNFFGRGGYDFSAEEVAERRANPIREGDTGSKGLRGEEGERGVPEHAIAKARAVNVGASFAEGRYERPHVPNNGRSHHQGGGKGGHA